MYRELESYARPATVAAALELLAAPGAALVAGGTRLHVAGHEHLRSVVDLQALPLAGVAFDAERVWLGALTPLADVLAAGLPPGLEALAEAISGEKNLALRNRSTLGGRVSRDRADARVTTALLALGAEVEVFTAGPDGAPIQRTIPLAARLAEIAASAGRPVGIVGGLVLPNEVRWSGYLSAQLSAVDAPMTDVALAVTPRGVTLASGVHGRSAAGTVLLPQAAAVAAAIAPATPEDAWRPGLRAALEAELPAHTDALVAGDYRKDLAITLALRLVGAWRATGGAA